MTPLVNPPDEWIDSQAPSLEEAIEIKRLESVIEGGLGHFVAVGSAFGAIKDRRLYRPAYKTFEDYCEQRWQVARRTAYQYIDAAEVFENVRNCAQNTPLNEAQCRPLVCLNPDDQREVWARASKTAPEGKLTAKHVAETVRQFRGESSCPPEPPLWTLHEAIDHLGRNLYEIAERWPQEHLAVMVQQLHELADELQESGGLCP